MFEIIICKQFRVKKCMCKLKKKHEKPNKKPNQKNPNKLK